MDASPTPFDITAVPSLPFTPSLLLWLIVIGMLLLPAIGLAFSARRQSQKPVLLQRATVERLKRLVLTRSGTDAKQTSSEAALLLRRFLAGQCVIATEALSGEELTRLADTQLPSIAKQLLPLLSEFEKVKFAADPDRLQIQSLVNRAVTILSEEHSQ